MSTKNRSVPYKRPFLSALFWTMLHWFALCFLIATLAVLIVQRDLRAAYPAAGALVGVGLTWGLSFVKRNNARCPLCKGTPYLNTGAGTHNTAFRLLPFNHGITAMLSTLLRLRFRCMYCGTPYDLLKPGHHRHRSARKRRSHRSSRKRDPQNEFRG